MQCENSFIFPQTNILLATYVHLLLRLILSAHAVSFIQSSWYGFLSGQWGYLESSSAIGQYIMPIFPLSFHKIQQFQNNIEGEAKPMNFHRSQK